jgi:hypothetical protein
MGAQGRKRFADSAYRSVAGVAVGRPNPHGRNEGDLIDGIGGSGVEGKVWGVAAELNRKLVRMIERGGRQSLRRSLTDGVSPRRGRRHKARSARSKLRVCDRPHAGAPEVGRQHLSFPDVAVIEFDAVYI